MPPFARGDPHYGARSSGGVSIAIGGGKVLAVSEAAHDLDRFIGDGTRVIDDPGLTLRPGLIDTHTHLIFAASDINDVHVNEPRTSPVS